MTFDTTQSVGSESALSYRDLDALYRIRENLSILTASISLLQTAADCLFPVLSNLEQMKLLANKCLTDSYDDDIKAQFCSDFLELNSNNCRMASITTSCGLNLFCDGQVIDLYSEGSTVLSLTTVSLIEVDNDLLNHPEEILQSIQEEISQLSSLRFNIHSLLATLREHCERLYCRSEELFSSLSSVNNLNTAASSAYRTATQIIQADNAAIAAHSNKIRTSASSLLN